MMKRKPFALISFLLIVISACIRPQYDNFSSIGEDHYLRMVIETPAGNLNCVHFHPSSNSFIQGNAFQKPAPLNFGFIPSSNRSKSAQEFDPIRVMLLSNSKPSGTILKIIPIGMLQFAASGKQRVLILAVPADPSHRKSNINDEAAISMTEPSIFSILELWLKNYSAIPDVIIYGWADENITWNYILDVLRLKS
ncbi:MAG TPA: inorganic diphosphatase [Bacteroidales bacterium]|jgi:inorganic pyrophosphatase|nr:inorganic diphosphatase [Bacteroidales bacterium]MDI9573816.1 inorganic diphosphatase [Bacteroidota bacterium]OQC61323.1 MAG: Inorganic pyrophosphatase [Bacteroidetes bacterium ADurb.Bin012]MBP9511073.1 inorganic diphosphatase [Bacteroidales bacterium]MBP9588058.1 inorganic diphosphatase [Bacteroidales bacterium]